MIILHIVFLNLKRANGLRYSVPGIVSAQNNIDGVNAGLFNVSSSDFLESIEYKNYDFPFFTDYKNIKNLPAPFNDPDIVVFQGLYTKEFIKIYKKLHSPYIIVPRVMMTENAQKRKKLKKRIANKLLFNDFIDNASAIHYLTENEQKESSHFTKESFVVGNGTSIPNVKCANSANEEQNKIDITFIGRLDIEHKGLDLLVESINLIKEELVEKNVEFNLYGPDFKNSINRLSSLLESYNVKELVQINGPIYNEEKERVLDQTDIFIAPSRYEGHPQAVIEAMAHGIPCILTPGTNMQDKLEKYDAGWNSSNDVESLSNTILTAITERDLNEKRKNAKKLVEENYTWEKVSYKTIQNYLSILKS